MKSLKHYLLIIAISSLPFISIFATSQMLHSHDGPMHLARMPAYYKAISEGQILPRWAAGFDYGYGTPLFNFYYHLPYLAAVLPMALGAGLVLSFKLILLASFLLSGVFMFAFTYELFGDIRKAYVATVLYQFAPFHLIDLMVRADIGETLALAFLPLMLLYITRIFHTKNNIYNIVGLGIATLLLILSHSSIGLMFFCIALAFVLLLAPNQAKRIEAGKGLILGLLLTMFFWLPVLVERKYTYGDFFMKDMYKSHFAPIWMFFVPNFTNAAKLQIGGIAVNFGLMQTMGLGIALWQLISKKIRASSKPLIIFTFVITLGALFLMQPPSTYFWSHVSMLRAFQFPWRFLNSVVVSLALLGAAVFIQKNTPKWLTTTIIVITILSTAIYWRPPLGFDTVNEASFWNYPLNTTYFGEIDVIWSAGMRGKYPTSPIEIIDGYGTIQNLKKQGTLHTFTITSTTPVRIVDNTQFFPGWRVFSDGKKVPIEFQDQNWRGLITFRLPAGIHTVRVVFGDSPIRQVAKYISMATIVATLLSLVMTKIKRKP